MLGRARIIPVSVFLLTAFFSTLGAPPSHAASCPGVPAPSSDGNVFAGVVYDAVGGVMKTCVGSTWVSLGSGGGGGGASTLAGLTDVSTSGIADGKALVYNATSSKWEPQTISGGGGSATLATLTDVDTTGAADGKSLVYNATSSKWVPMTISGGGGGSGTVSGTTGKLSKFVSSTEVGDSVITESSGNIGIGMTPTSLLTLNAGVNDGLRLNNGTVNGVVFNTSDNSMTVGTVSNHPLNLYTSNTAKVTVLANGNVGIGTASPATKLDVAGIARAETVAIRSTTPYITFTDTEDPNGSYGSITQFQDGTMYYDADTNNTPSPGRHIFRVDGSTRTILSLVNNGNVGIGTTSPSGKLHITGTGGGGYTTSDTLILQRTDATNPTGRIDFVGSGGTGSTRWSILTDADVTNDFGVAYNGSKIFHVSTGGEVGINTVGNAVIANATGVLNITQTAGHDALNIRSNAGGNNMLNLWKSNGTGSMIAFYTGGSQTLVGNISSDASSTTYGTSSDLRLKENLIDTHYGLKDLLNIKVYDFSFRNDKNHKTVSGFIAQEVQNVYPDAVTTNGDDGTVPLADGAVPWSVDYGRLTPLLVRAIQELKADNDNLRAELKAANDNYQVELQRIRQELNALKTPR